MNRIMNFIRQHKIFSAIYALFILSLLSKLISGKSFVEDIVDICVLTLVFIYINNSKTFTKKVSVCSNCSTTIEPGQQFCGVCGNAINVETNVTVKRKYRKGNIIRILGIFIALFPFGMCTVLFGIGSLFYAMFGGSFDNWDSNMFTLAFQEPFLPLTIVCGIVGIIMIVIGSIIKNKDK